MASHHARASAVPNPRGTNGRGETTNKIEIVPPWRADKKNSRVEGVEAAQPRRTIHPEQVEREEASSMSSRPTVQQPTSSKTKLERAVRQVLLEGACCYQGQRFVGEQIRQFADMELITNLHETLGRRS